MILFLLFAVVFPIRSQLSLQQNEEDELVAGRNVNMVAVDPYLQRQNEPSIAGSTLNQPFLLAGANDYSLVDWNGAEVGVTHDAWLGVFKSLDGGESWEHDMLPPFQGVLNGGQIDTSHPLYGFDAAADPTIRAGINGWFFYSGIAFDRTENGDSVVFVNRFQDTGDDIVYVDTNIIDSGTSGQFSDKPWIVVDVPRPGYPQGIVYCIYSVFMGAGNNIHSKILISRSIDGGLSWEKPLYVSESEQTNQGTTVAVDPDYGWVYIAWRLFADTNSPHGILIAKSEDFGRTFSKSVEVASIPRPFDQATIGGTFQSDPSQFRTNVYPTMAIDSTGRIYIAWSQRDVDYEFQDDARIVITSLARENWGASWPAPIAVESPVSIPDPREGFPPTINIHSHQFMPSLTYAAGKLMTAWYDNRYSARVFDAHGIMRDNPCPPGESSFEDPADRIMDDLSCITIENGNTIYPRETIDVRTAEAFPGDNPDFEDSIQVSKYIWILEDNGNETYMPIQGQFNPPNYKLFGGGTVPFHGDYLDVAPIPMFIQEGNGWRFTSDSDPFLFYVSWTDNRDVLPPNDNIWTNYIPADPGDPNCAGVTSGMRNQNIYVSKITRGIEVDVLGEFLDENNKQVFVISINNKTGSPGEDPEVNLPFKSFQLDILSPQGAASFFPEPLPSEPPPYPPGTTEQTIFVDVPDHSSITRMIFVSSSGAYPLQIEISEIGGGFTDTVALSPGNFTSLSGSGILISDLELINWTAPPYNPPEAVGGQIANPNILTPNILTPNILTPNILTPNILTPNILTPNILTPNILTPNILTPNILTPNILNPNILTMSILNPNILTPNILTGAIGDDTEVVDKTWTVTNSTNAVSSYTFKSIAGDSLPVDVFPLQLLIFKVHNLPGTNGCLLSSQVQHELLVNITNPDLIYIVDPSDIKKILGDANIEFENATFSLGPYEEAVVLLRIIDTNPNNSALNASDSGSFRTLDTLTSEAESFADNLGGVVVAHTSTEDSPSNAVTLMILNSGLPSGKAGVPYTGATIRALGGSSAKSWSIIEGRLPEGLIYQLYNDPIDDPDLDNLFVISGTPKEAGNFTFTLEVITADDSDTQKFSLTIAEPDPLVLTMNPVPVPSGAKTFAYGGVTFTVSGGVPPYSWDPAIGAPLNLGLTAPAGDPPSDTQKELTGIPIEAGDFTVMIQVWDNYVTLNPQPATLEFDLCISPLPLEVIISPELTPPQNPEDPHSLPDGFLSSSYEGVVFTVLNSEAPPLWTIEGLPLGVQYNTDGAILSIDGSPTYDPNVAYPKTYTVDVSIEDSFYASCDLLQPRVLSQTLSLTVHPKSPEWAWESSFSGEATAVTLESSGVYVTGWIDGGASGKDYFTAKYDDSGEVWRSQYAGLYDDIPTAIVAGDTGIFVTGSSVGEVSGEDIYTIKYDLSGNVLWEARYDGPSHLGDGANALAMDLAGNVYVGGFVHRGNQKKHADYLIIKYNPTGIMLWDETYDSRRNGNDVVTAIAVDAEGNLIITGKSQESLSKEETSHDFFTVKYDPSGNLIWEARDDGPDFGPDVPTAILVDPAGNVYVTGQTTGGPNGADYYTVKYNSSGNPLWNFAGMHGRVYNGPGNGDDIPIALAIDGSGNIYVTGTSIGVDSFDYATVKYDGSGNPLWNFSGDFALRTDDDSGRDESVAVAVDSGDVILTGYVTAQEKGLDILTLCTDVDGQIQWIARYPTSDIPNGDEMVSAMSVDAGGIYIVGSSEKEGVKKVIVLKYSR